MLKGINIPIYMTHKDILYYISSWSSNYNLNVGFIAKSKDSFTFNLQLLDKNSNILELLKESSSVVFSITEFKIIGINRPHIFLENNPNMLELNIGEETSETLKESWPHTLKILEDENANMLWQKLGRVLKKDSQCGAFGVNEKNGIKIYNKQIRFTEDVIRLYKNNVKILPTYGKGVHYELTKL
jgi:hypothetical protein